VERVVYAEKMQAQQASASLPNGCLLREAWSISRRLATGDGGLIQRIRRVARHRKIEHF